MQPVRRAPILQLLPRGPKSTLFHKGRHGFGPPQDLRQNGEAACVADAGQHLARHTAFDERQQFVRGDSISYPVRLPPAGIVHPEDG